MKTNTKTNTALANALIKNSKNTVNYINGKDFIGYDNFIANMNNCFYAYYLALDNNEKSENITEKENACYQSLRLFLDFVGNINGAKIKANAPTINNENGERSTLFNDCLSFCHCQKVNVIDKDLQALIDKKKDLSKQARNFLNLEKMKDYKAVEKQIESVKNEIATLKAIDNTAVFRTQQASNKVFAKNFEIRLRQVIVKQSAKTVEEMQAEKNARKQAKKARQQTSTSNNK